jgi:hypothetical protein
MGGMKDKELGGLPSWRYSNNGCFAPSFQSFPTDHVDPESCRLFSHQANCRVWAKSVIQESGRGWLVSDEVAVPATRSCVRETNNLCRKLLASLPDGGSLKAIEPRQRSHRYWEFHDPMSHNAVPVIARAIMKSSANLTIQLPAPVRRHVTNPTSLYPSGPDVVFQLAWRVRDTWRRVDVIATSS